MSPFVSDVTACGDCPLFQTDDRNGEWCGHPNGGSVRVATLGDTLPQSCPLRTQPLLVQIARTR